MPESAYGFHTGQCPAASCAPGEDAQREVLEQVVADDGGVPGERGEHEDDDGDARRAAATATRSPRAT